MDDELKQTSGTEDDDRQLPTPHFDDEATLLSARPVVPFNQLSAAKNPRRRLYFGAALVIALLIGLFGGIFYAHLNERPDVRGETGATATQEELVSTTEAPAESPESPAEPTDEVGLPAKTTVTATTVREIPRPRRNPARITEKTASRPARPLRTEGPRRDRTSDDMFRIHEIFEGSSRP